MKTAVTTQQLSKVYPPPAGWWRAGRSGAPTAVADISLTIECGELFGLLGPNGAGKTTLVKILCSLLLPTSGQASVAGHSLADPLAIRAAVGLVVSDERSFFWRLSARRNLLFFAALHGLHGRMAEERVTAVLRDVDLLEVANQRFSDYSSGLRQRLAIARGLLHQPAVLFLDEPSRSLDPTATQKLHTLLLRLMTQREMTVFLITHDLAEAEKLCSRVALLHQGRIQAVGRPADLRRQLRPQLHYGLRVDAAATAVVPTLLTFVPGLHVEPLAAEGLRLRFAAAEEDGMLTAVIDHLRQAGYAIYTIEGTPPTLEEVFTHYTQSSS